MPRKIDPAHRERAVRFVPNHRAECPTMWLFGIEGVEPFLGVVPWRWVEVSR